jgi:type II restriction enzyme
VINLINDLLLKIKKAAQLDFIQATKNLIEYVDRIDISKDILAQIGAIPESIEHDSTEEKLYAKVSDAILARAFREIGLKASVITERGDSADVQIKSPIYGYTMVADAKAFRLSRTAKNQKDFKVTALSGWRKDADYAVLCSPYFQYPNSQSQIYIQSIDHNVCLLSWEHLIFMVKNNIKETVNLNLAPLWNFADKYSHVVVAADRKKCFIKYFNNYLFNIIGDNSEKFYELLEEQIQKLSKRGAKEIRYWKKKKEKIKFLSREEAIRELIKAQKIDEKITQIRKFINGVKV